MDKDEQLGFTFSYSRTPAPMADSGRVVRMNDVEFALFFDRFKRGEVVSSRNMQAKEMGDTFLCVGMKYFADFTDEELASIGFIYNYIDESLPNKKNTCFLTCKLLHKDDASKLDKKLASLLNLDEKALEE